MTLAQTLTAVGPNLTSSFLASGGTPPYTYLMQTIPWQAGSSQFVPAGGTVNSSTGVYTAPALVNGGQYTKPNQLYDRIIATDSAGLTASALILVGNPLLLFCEIIQNQMNLPIGRVYLWDQKIMQPSDAGVFVAVKIMTCKPFGNTNAFQSTGSDSNSIQSVNMFAQLELDVISRDAEARDRKEEVIMALKSTYAQSQQEANSFYIAKIPPGAQFINLSEPDGAAIPYRFNISVGMQYFVSKTQAINSFDSFQTPQVNTNP